MTKIIFVLTVAVLILFSPLCTRADSEIRVAINGVLVEFEQSPLIIDGRVFVPLRGVFEAMSFSAEWDNPTKTVYLTDLFHNRVTVTIGRYHFMLNDVAIPMEVPAQIINDRVMLPLRAITEKFYSTVEWNEEQQIVDLRDYSFAASARIMQYHPAFEPFTFFVVTPSGEIVQKEAETRFLLSFIFHTWIELNELPDISIINDIPVLRNVGRIGMWRTETPDNLILYFPRSEEFEAYINGEHGLFYLEALEKTLRGMYHFNKLELIFLDM